MSRDTMLTPSLPYCYLVALLLRTPSPLEYDVLFKWPLRTKYKFKISNVKHTKILRLNHIKKFRLQAFIQWKKGLEKRIIIYKNFVDKLFQLWKGIFFREEHKVYSILQLWLDNGAARTKLVEWVNTSGFDIELGPIL